MGETTFSVSLDHLTNASVIQMRVLSALPEQTAWVEVGVEGGSLTLHLSPEESFYHTIILFHLQERMKKFIQIQ